MTQKMNPVVKELWLAALRSGTYDQTTGSLRTHKGFCCLGVLCEVAVQQGAIGEYYGLNGSLPSDVAKWAGMDGNSYGDYGTQDLAAMEESLTNDNDAKHHDFNTIADTIEREF